MEDLIPVVNKLHDVFSLIDTTQTPLDLPVLVVIGSQSSGKSSVLENLVGKDFLPRGSGIVTRRPLILQLIHIKKSSVSEPTKVQNELDSSLDFEWNEHSVLEENEWGEFLHIPNKKFHNFNEIRQEIERETDRITGKNKGVSNIPINLKIYSPHVLNLTLVDLPGLTKVPVGDQPKDIELKIKAMIMQFIEKPNTIILAVSAANVDLANSDALQLAKLVDPEGSRTLGVLTKLDLMDKGTDALEVLNGKLIPLRLGFIGVVNRSQKDINERKSIKEAVKAEQEFFNSDPKYKSVQHRCGTQYLGKRCAEILISHIKKCLPELKQKVTQLIIEQTKLLETLGDTAFDSNRGALLLQIINEFADRYSKTINGQLDEDTSVSKKLVGGARINYLFNQIFAKHLLELNPLDNLNATEIRTIITNSNGPKSSLFIPEAAFDLLVRKQISTLKDPALLCVDLVIEELEKIVNSIRFLRLERFSNLREELIACSNQLIQSYQVNAREMITNMMNMEIAFINTNHPHFNVDQIIANVMTKRSQLQTNPPPQIHQEITNNPQKKPPQQNGIQIQNPPPIPTVPQQSYVPPAHLQQQNNSKDTIFSAFFGTQSKPKSKAETKYYDDFGFVPAELNRSSPPRGLDKVPEKINGQNIPEKKEFEIELLENLLIQYFDIVRTNVIDFIPKSIMYFLVCKSQSDLQNNLIQKLYKEESFEKLLSEASDVMEKREKAKNLLSLLHKSSKILNEVKDYTLR